ncbi:MAG: MltA domain-containing protein [bacterium]|nr:MltA domain-containing protein [bacterium]
MRPVKQNRSVPQTPNRFSYPESERRPYLLPFTLIILVLLVLCCNSLWADTQAELLPPDAIPLFSDDLHYQGLKESLEQSLAYLDKLPPERQFSLAGHCVDQPRLKKTLQVFLELVRSEPDTARLNRTMREKFLIYRVVPSANITSAQSEGTKPLLLTGYYLPVFKGSLQKMPPYIYPLYRVPKALVQQKTATGTSIGRWEKGRLLPFWSRKEIEQGNLLAGKELVWLQDPFDAFLVHIQGSALIQLREDQSIRALRFAAKNGRPYTSIGSYLVRNGKMRLEEVSMESLRRYLEAHPQEREQILRQNESYIFFSWGKVGPAYGSLNRPLTPGRSVAADQKLYPPGMIAFVRSSIPQTGQAEQGKPTKPARRVPLERFVTVQDSGSAITGLHRLDLFCGTGEAAGQVAGEMKERGEVFLLLSKDD